MLNLDKVLVKGAGIKRGPVVGDDVRNGVMKALKAKDDSLELRGYVGLNKDFQETVSGGVGLRGW